jgi:hypothetical protein
MNVAVIGIYTKNKRGRAIASSTYYYCNISDI